MGQPIPPDYGPPPPPRPEPLYEHAQASQPGGHPYGDYAYVIREEEAPAPRQPRPRASGPVTSSPASEPPQEQAEPASEYGPGDPAYGPPSAGWYTAEAQAGRLAAEELQPARGVFEPHPNQGDVGQEDPADDRPPLEKIRNFYLTAEASAENLDRQFDELLERQRQLISAYFTQTALQEDPR